MAGGKGSWGMEGDTGEDIVGAKNEGQNCGEHWEDLVRMYTWREPEKAGEVSTGRPRPNICFSPKLTLHC